MNRRAVAFSILASMSFSGPCAGGALENLQQGNPQAQHVWRASEDSVAVPFEWHDGHLVIAVRVNDSAPLRLAFDTGASATVLFETERTRGLRLQAERQIPIGGASGVDLVNDAKVSLAAVDITNLTILHVPLRNSPIFANDDEAYFDGAVGGDLLHRFVTQIDYAKQLIRFSKGPVDVAADPTWRIVPIDVRSRVPVIAVQLRSGRTRSESVRLLVDSGAPSYAYMNPDLIKRIAVPARNYVTRGRSFNGPYERVTARLAAFSVAGFAFPGLVTHFDRTDFKDLGRAVGLIGNGVLRNFDLIFDYRAGTLALRPNAHFTANSRADRSGIDLQPHRSGAIVRSVATGSEAERLGLKAGDVVTDIDGQSLGADSFDEV
ncbi:MAG TPA: aspartyl protease family protein, partial [Steroidobacteraceae bacterium]|nr:aspartyl protease family protein [Steroidobacteraceae bacterium]